MHKNFKNLDFALSLVNFDNRFFKKKIKVKNNLKSKNMSKEKLYKIKFANKINGNCLAAKKQKKAFSF